MADMVVGSILHGAYGDLYEQALCLKHYAITNPGVELRLFAATQSRLNAFRVLDLSFAASFDLWTTIESYPDLQSFFQFQVHDVDLHKDALQHLPESVLAKLDRTENRLPWRYMRDHKLIPAPERYALELNSYGREQLTRVAAANGVREEIWSRPTISFLWRYRKGQGAISSRGQKPEAELVAAYSKMFRDLIARFDCHILVCGMNVVTDETNRERTDNKYPSFGLELPADRVTYMQGLSWPLELEIASRATVCCGHASGFTEGQWIKRGRDMVLMDAPPHYLAKAAYHRMPLFGLNNPIKLAGMLLNRSPESYGRDIAAILKARQ